MDYSDYPPEKTPYAMRDANYIIRKAREHGENIGSFAERLLSGTFPWAMLRQAQKLLRLTEKYGNERIDAACRRAIGFELINVNRVQRIVEQSLENEAEASNDRPPQIVQLPLRFLRDPKTFNHNHCDEEKDSGNQDVS